MIKNFFAAQFILTIFSILIFPQQIIITGKVTDKATAQSLSFANIRISETFIGTAANIDGEFELKLAKKGTYKIIASHIGYYSDTLIINTDLQINKLDFKLTQTEVILPEIIVNPGVNSALEIIRKAIGRKKIIKSLLKTSEVEAYTKGIIRTTEDITSSDNSIGVGIGGNDTTDLVISGILENHSINYFEQPDNYKSIVLARTQSANIPPSINILTGGRLIQNFYENDLNFLGKDLPSPISDDALDYYYYRIESTSYKNALKVYNIFLEPNLPSDPGFTGNIFIADSTYDLIKADLFLNRAANTGGVFDTVNIFQQFDEFSGIQLPIDYRLFVKANLLGLVRIGFELNTILFNYKINQQLPDDIFNKAILTVLPDADDKDSSYWISTPTIPNTPEEQAAYARIDSLEKVPWNFWENFSLLSTQVNLNKNISVSAPLSLYHFSRVEGHSLDFGIFANDLLNKRLNSFLKLSYGFSDEKFNQDFFAGYLLGDYRTWEIKLNIFNKLKVLFEDSDNYGELFSTLVTLISKDEFRDYYYSKGFEFEVEGELFPVLKVRTGFSNKTSRSALVNTNFSFFNRNKDYRSNPIIFPSTINTLNFGFDIDFRDYIEDGYFRRRTSLGRSFVLFSGDIHYSDKNKLGSDLNFKIYEFKSRMFIRTFKSASLNLNIYTRYTDGTTAYQDLYSLPGNIDAVFNSETFRTLNLNEIAGDKIFTLNLTHNFSDELFRLLNIPVIKNWEIMLSLIFNMAVSELNESSKLISPYSIRTFKHPFYELGFGIGQGIIPFKIEFMWKLNYLDGNNFRVGLNMPML
ncbi:MAG: DUF5686 and carboxypeptidase regulatory-like domain-containing protein [Ignavibacterium sp.]|nr:DUF5686 and carboxypeptidase regulatory-like domain-containing protein [Ignavibacterium sp.]